MCVVVNQNENTRTAKRYFEGENSNACYCIDRNLDKSFIVYRKNNAIHRDEDLPAYITKDRYLYFKEGYAHRDNGPAVIKEDGTLEWWKNGKLHRLSHEGPAIIKPDGSVEYRENRRPHRLDGPAVIKTNKNAKDGKPVIITRFFISGREYYNLRSYKEGIKKYHQSQYIRNISNVTSSQYNSINPIAQSFLSSSNSSEITIIS